MLLICVWKKAASSHTETAVTRTGRPLSLAPRARPAALPPLPIPFCNASTIGEASYKERSRVGTTSHNYVINIKAVSSDLLFYLSECFDVTPNSNITMNGSFSNPCKRCETY